LQRFLWIPVISLFASSILDRATTLFGLSTGFVEINPVQSWIISHSFWFFYTSALIFPASISLTILLGLRVLDGPNFHYQRRALAVFFVALSLFSWTPVVNNLIMLRFAS
jgi:uncharacterized protein DUF5658